MLKIETLLEKTYKKALAHTKKRFDPDQNFQFEFSSSPDEQPLLSVFSTDGKLVLKGKYLKVGFYDHRSSVWHWAWNSTLSNKKDTEMKHKFLSWVTYLEKEYGKKISPLEGDRFLFYLKEGYFYARPSTLPLLIKLFLLLSKALWVFPVSGSRNPRETRSSKTTENTFYTEYVALSSILQIS